MASAVQTTPDTPVTIKVNIDGVARRFKLPLRDVGVNVLETKLRNALAIPLDADALFERYSDSAAAYVILDQADTAVYKQLYRAAKAKHKLKLRVTVKPVAQPEQEEEEQEKEGPQPASVADEPEEEETRPSLETTDVEPEREPELPTFEAPASTLVDEQLVVEEAVPEDVKYADEFNLRSLKEALEEAPAAPAAPPAPVETQPQTQFVSTVLPQCTMPCPAMRANYAVCCNSCDRTIPDAHYHCSTCDDGDFDLCQDCVSRGVTCKGANHWLIKRFVKHGIIINSTTERVGPKPKPKPLPRQEPVQAAPERIIPVFNDFLYTSFRTCNCCVQELPEVQFLHCSTCDDFDLCKACFSKNRHGHHPKHAFVAAVEGTRFDPDVSVRLGAGRGQHHNAICDGCDAAIKGVRHKCLDCPDWDYCTECIVNAGFIHPGHRFVPIYEPLEVDGAIRMRSISRPVHMGICCDGPLCSSARAGSNYIVGDRFKCAVCHDTDFCASCEASPANTHNRTHPLIKFKTPVRHVSVTTTGENLNGRQMPAMGDRRARRSAAAPVTIPEMNPTPSLFTGIQTVVDLKPSEPVKAEEMPAPVEEKEVEAPAKPQQLVDPFTYNQLVATFVRDTVTDGTTFGPDHVFEQTWFLRNTGTVPWPAGCSVKFVGGDYMGHLDSEHPAATRDVEYSYESTISYVPILPGEEFPFTVLLRTPRRSGRVVSNWRLTTKDGHKFGHRLWCDVVVEKPKVVLPPPTVAEPVKQVEKKLEVVEAKSEPEPEHSQMIFPKLEKESPVSSVHEDAKAEPAPAPEEEYEDCEDDEWNEAASEGYMTDEEYDILDASDEEFHHRK
ncbi:next to BRCA1 gene 1 protein [Staphylotrichum tortipilum]|uniref:Next to BRCA1 gene 1 protein n=1 Tax=Staphylotrichum tortipilum TaxID=2831512 RepID=A0AAN6RSE3_9PEZI|nr:next to BRCA1 gene 1 protein [Staphylotrichum longicolle]